MTRTSIILAISACACLLLIQVFGLHQHVDDHGDDAGIHGAHVHQVAQQPHHDHSLESDVASAEQINVSWAKLAPVMFAFATVLVALGGVLLLQQFLPAVHNRIKRSLHWRPPLRAPPVYL